MINLIKKLFSILFNKASNAVDNMEDAVAKCQNAINKIDTYMEELEAQKVDVLHRQGKFDALCKENDSSLEKLEKQARRLKERGDTNQAGRVVARMLKLEHRRNQAETINSRFESEIEGINKVMTDLKMTREDLRFEISDLETQEKFAEFRIDSNQKVRGIGSAEGIEKIIDDARRKVEDKSLLADAYDEVYEEKRLEHQEEKEFEMGDEIAKRLEEI